MGSIDAGQSGAAEVATVSDEIRNLGRVRSQALPSVSVLCPTFHRTRLLANAYYCFLMQDYPGYAEMLILDDGGDLDMDFGTRIRTDYGIHGIDNVCRLDLPMLALGRSRDVFTMSAGKRYGSLPEKYNALAAVANGSILVVWEDDDVLLPFHLTATVRAILEKGTEHDMTCSKPSEVLSTYSGKPATEAADGRFHASLGFTRSLFDRVGGWPITKRADFDQQFIAKLTKSGIPGVMVADPIDFAPPSYVFRYGSTQAYHGQHFMRSPDDTDWYDRVPRQPGDGSFKLVPFADEETERLLKMYPSHPLPVFPNRG